MPIITKISTQKKSTERFNVFLDGQYAFSVDEEVLARYQLMKGKEISSIEISEIGYEDEIRKGVNTAIQFLSFRMRSEKEMKEHLKQKEYDETIIKEVVHKLYSQKYLDDLEFAKAFVRTQINSTKKGPGTIKMELKDKGINDTNIEKAMKEYKRDIQILHAISLAEKTIKQNQTLSEKLLKQKIEQVLIRKGYSFEIAQIIFDEVSYKKDDNEEWKALQQQGLKQHRKYQKYSGFEYEQKMKQALYRKGFSIDQIEKFLNEIGDE